MTFGIDWYYLTSGSYRPLRVHRRSYEMSSEDGKPAEFGTGSQGHRPHGQRSGLSPDRPRKDLVAAYFNTNAFQQAVLGTFGNAGRNILRGPGTFSVDFSAMKNIHIRERFRVQYRAELFNIFNTPLLNNPNASVPDSRFGQITSARDPRIIQMAVKLYF